MRTFITLITCLYILAPTFAIAQKDESCDANPRWLLVTVLAEETWSRSDEKDQLERVPEFTHTEERLKLLDRCEIEIFSAYRKLPGSLEYPGASDDAVATTITDYTQANGKTERLTQLWVKESLQDICRAMRDCEDTTSRP